MEKIIKLLKEEISKLRGYAVIIDGEDGEWEPVTTVSVEDIYGLINQLDKLEVLSQEWIESNSVYASSDGVTEEYVHVDDLQKLLVPKQEVTIDKEDAENIVQYKEMGWTLSHLINDYGEDARHDELLAKAWLAYPNIEVEEEQKYIVSDNSSIPLLIKNDSGEIMSYDSQIAYNNSNGTIELTEEEIKSYDERYMTFAKPVEEIEK